MTLIKCSDCGKEISDTSKTCIHCGCPIVKKVKCSECGQEMFETERVCSNCGNKMGGTISINVNNIDVKKINFHDKKTIIFGAGVLILITIIVVVFIFKGSNKIDIQEIYNNIGCDSTYCEVSNDNSYLEIDSNPYNLDDYSSYTATGYIEKANIEFGFSEALYTRMGKTRALDGTLTEENDKVKVSWTYHPDQGIEVVYTLK